jgi:hypothetical protein
MYVVKRILHIQAAPRGGVLSGFLMNYSRGRDVHRRVEANVPAKTSRGFATRRHAISRRAMCMSTIRSPKPNGHALAASARWPGSRR